MRRGVDFHAEAEFLRQHRQTQILHQHRVHAGRVERDELAFGSRQLVGENQHVECSVTADIVFMEILHQRLYLIISEIVGALPGVELLEAEIDSVSAVGNGGASAIPVTGRSEKFGFHVTATT